MATAYYSHDDCLQHLMPDGHPERVERLGAVRGALEGMELDRRAAPLGDEAEILRCHPQSHLDRIKDAVPSQGMVKLDADTSVSPGSYQAALRGVGGICAGVDAVISGEVGNAFVGCRPPGHHAERETPMGFCLFGNVAIGAMRALDHHGLGRVAIIDFDVHHGNGTQDLLWSESRALFASSHQMPLYPGTGAKDETGAHSNILNVPLAANSGSTEMRAAYSEIILPRIEAFAPELILISAGFDAHRDDPLAQLNWDAADFAWLTGAICDVAKRTCNGRIVSTLEGGYDLSGLAAGVAAHVEILRERAA